MLGSLVVLSLMAMAALASCGGGDEGGSGSAAQGGGASTTTEAVSSSPGVDLTALPLGDGKISDGPRAGYVYSCQSDFNDNAGGAVADGPWIDSERGTWNAEEKVAVPGEHRLDSRFDVGLAGGGRVISGNDQPSDPVGTFPVPSDSQAYQYDPNPNAIGEQDFEIELPAMPEQADSPSCLSLGAIGVVLNGSYFFNALDGPGRDAVAHEIQDGCDGHPERSGAYHYHSLSTCIEHPDDESGGHSELVGYAIDGFGLYGHRGEDGEDLTNADLDECHGHRHEIEWDGNQVDLYHYHATYEYPYTVGCYRGAPVEDEDLGAGGGPPGAIGGGPPGP